MLGRALEVRVLDDDVDVELIGAVAVGIGLVGMRARCHRVDTSGRERQVDPGALPVVRCEGAERARDVARYHRAVVGKVVDGGTGGHGHVGDDVGGGRGPDIVHRDEQKVGHAGTGRSSV